MYSDFPVDDEDEGMDGEDDSSVTIENMTDDDFSDIGEDEMEDLEDEMFDLGF